jgi:hypothetical protein
VCLSRIVEEIFPFGHYFTRKRRQWQRCQCNTILDAPPFDRYRTLSEAQLSGRLKEEHERASAMDDKTFKLTLSLSIGLTVLGSTAALVIKAVASWAVQIILALLIGLGLFYVLSAGFVALGALRTLPTHGFGTQFVLQQQANGQNALAAALARQETMNIIRHLRNETAYQALRNGLILLFASILIFAGTLAYQSLFPLPQAGG